MEIRPTTIVKLFSGVPLDNTYTDTLYFTSKTAQSSYFAGLTPVKTFTSQMYQRVNKGQFEANCKADDIYNCNYMAFQNSGFGDKWFYAFINSIEYINNNNSLVTFEIDVMQTWMFDCHVERCFIERQHSVTDTIGGNILPEPVACGEYVYENYDRESDLLEKNAIVMMTSESVREVVDPTEQHDESHIFDGVYSGCYVYAVDSQSQYAESNIQEVIDFFQEKPEGILCIYMCPLYVLPLRHGHETWESSYHNLYMVPGSQNNSSFQFSKTAISTSDGFQGYIPKNKKLYTYPFNFFHVDNGDGDSINLRYEFFQNLTPRFKLEGNITPPIQVRLTPYNYRDIVYSHYDGNHNEYLIEDRAEFLTISSYPMGSWNYDTYRAWVAQNSVPIAVKTGAAIAGMAIATAGTILTGGALSPLMGVAGVGLASSIISQDYKASIQADTCKGNISSGNVNFASKKKNFYMGRCHVTKDYAEMIDNFFSMYGYAYNKIGVPNTHSRPHWNYVKTVGAKIIGQCPCDDLKKMCEIYDNGITFWKNPSEVGSYELDNSPTN